MGKCPLGAEIALDFNHLLQSRWYNRNWCQSNRLSYRELYTSHFKRIKVALHFHSRTFFMPPAEGQSVGVLSAALGRLHSTCGCQRRKTGNGGMSAEEGLKCFQAGWLRQMCCTWRWETPWGEAYCRQLSGRFLGIAQKFQRPCIRKCYQDCPWRKEELFH